MATCRDIVKRSLRKVGVIAAGREPSATTAADALVSLQSLYLELIGQGVFGRMRDVAVTGDTYTANEQDRILVDNLDDTTITLPDLITAPPPCDTSWPVGDYDYGFSFYSTQYPRPPFDGAVVCITAIQSAFSRNYVYDSNIGRWTEIEGLTLDSDAPLGNRYQEGLACRLAQILSPEFPGVPPSPEVTKGAQTFNSAISHRRDSGTRRPVLGEYF